MKKIKVIMLLAVVTLLASCTQTNENTNTNTNTQASAGELVESSTGGISVDLTKKYHYLDSLNLSFNEDTFGDLISKTPYTIVYFYPLDFTPNCTIQALDFSAMVDDFAKLGYQIIGVSKNDIESHKAFAEAHSLKIKLIQDSNSDLLKEFGALGEPTTYGNGDQTTDIIRSTVIIDSKGTPIHAFYDVEAVGHAQRIYDLVKNNK
ncbi:MAG: peroxiredoxin [Candidatus Altimarinota bacterium]